MSMSTGPLSATIVFHVLYKEGDANVSTLGKLLNGEKKCYTKLFVIIKSNRFFWMKRMS